MVNASAPYLGIDLYFKLLYKSMDGITKETDRATDKICSTISD